ncbi:hypothetical protein BJ973_004201 [Actinoplanes tereljensis]|uniref:Uncharacterized protein n=1 Tax=Paractinoplanes tereljensis TaxID=571912 RepID=A0A919NU65_9ACTN|nr:hypothetical protein [Actinoplanes tereljensis]GIF23592.1 hypothetical protein Ate02nite_63220 [Actinoplanes tereljensis]
MSDTDLERRLRRALAARSAAVTAQDLRPAADPVRAERRGVVSRWWLPLAAGLAAAAVSIAAFVLLRPTDSVPPPLPPAASPSPEPEPTATATASPSPTATSSQAAPIPSSSTRPPSGSPTTTGPASGSPTTTGPVSRGPTTAGPASGSPTAAGPASR